MVAVSPVRRTRRPEEGPMSWCRFGCEAEFGKSVHDAADDGAQIGRALDRLLERKPGEFSWGAVAGIAAFCVCSWLAGLRYQSCVERCGADLG